MGKDNNSSTIAMKEIPLDIKIPKTIKTTNNSKFFIYLPNETFELSNGKNFENGFWSVTKSEITKTKIIFPNSKNNFQFLLLNKNSIEDEIATNIYYKNNQLTTGPFISADYMLINPNEIDIKIKSFTPDTTFEIEGIPKEVKISKGSKITSEIWEFTEKEAQNINIKLPENKNFDQLHITIIGTNTKNTRLKTHFNLIINLKENKTPHKTKYKETIIPAEKLIKQSKIKYDKYILILKDIPEYCCVENATKLENKWIVAENKNKEVIIKNYNTKKNEIEIKIEFIILNTGLPTNDNTYMQKIKCNFKDEEIKTKDFTKCIVCKNMKNCKLFKDFMNYIGYSTILKHIIHK